MLVTNDISPNFVGKFIVNKNISSKNIEVLNKFMEQNVDKCTNRNFIKKKPYDIYVKELAPDKLEFTTFFKNVYTKLKKLDKPIFQCFI